MEALRRRHYALCQARADDMVTIDRLRSALNAKELGIPHSQVTGETAQGSLLEGIHDPRHEIAEDHPMLTLYNTLHHCHVRQHLPNW
jgi:hypothetical protein